MPATRSAGNPPPASGRNLGQRLYFWLVRAARGGGRPTTKAALDAQYRAGEWKRLDELAELAPCIVVAGYVHHLADSPRVLDVGCGLGRLARLLAHFPTRHYLGIDLSSEAIQRARAAAIPRAEFAVADFETWLPDGEFDVIVFQDSLYYAREPLEVVRRFERALAPGGIFVVSMYHYSNNALILKKLGRAYPTLDETVIRNARGRWSVRALRPAG